MSTWTIQPEWDMLQAITTTLKKLHTQPKLLYVKSHQDNQQDYATLPLQAKLNVDADKLTGNHHNQTQHNTTIALLLQGTTAQLTSPLGTIMSKIPKTIRNDSSKPTIKKIHPGQIWVDEHSILLH